MSVNDSNSIHSLPREFLSASKQLFPTTEEFDRFVEALDASPSISIRWRGNEKGGQYADQITWCESGEYVPRTTQFVYDPHWHAGRYYVQEASSMFAGELVKLLTKDMKSLLALDLCAAPGGKSTHLIDALPEGSFLIANEVNRKRVGVLSENLMRWGSSDHAVTNLDPSDFSNLEPCFDLMLVDAPCSGEGMFRKDPASRSEWSPDSVQLCAARQRRILADVWPALRPGGMLIYSTCTYNTAENDENLAWLADEMDAEILSLPSLPSVAVPNDDSTTARFYPHHARGEGFCIAVVRKSGDQEPLRWRKARKLPFSMADKTQTEVINNWLLTDHGQAVIQHQETLRIVPERWLAPLMSLTQDLRFQEIGIAVAEISRKGLRPLQGLAWSRLLDEEAFEVEDLPKSNAIRFLQRDPLPNPEKKQGIMLFKYEGSTLGFGKAVGNRVNNQYPMPYRIRKRLSDKELNDLDLIPTDHE